MTISNSDLDVATPSATKAAPNGSYLEWSAIFGGAVLSAAITTVMAAFGSGIKARAI